jgi:hypothetical protein
MVERDEPAEMDRSGCSVAAGEHTMTVDAVIFDWGGTLTPWHTVDFAECWRACGLGDPG